MRMVVSRINFDAKAFNKRINSDAAVEITFGSDKWWLVRLGEGDKYFEMMVDALFFHLLFQPPRFDGSKAAERVATPGVSVGLVWIAFGGKVQFVETKAMVVKGDLKL